MSRLSKSERNSLIECFSGSSRKSLKHSSITRSAPTSAHLSRIFFSKFLGVVTPVGLFGSQMKTISVSAFICVMNSSVRENPSISFSSNSSISVPCSSIAALYSANVGAVIKALRGFTAAASLKIRSSAPFPQRQLPSSTCSRSEIALQSLLQSGSGYLSAVSSVFMTAVFIPSVSPRGLTFTEKSRGSYPNLSSKPAQSPP